MAITLLGAAPRPDDASGPDLGCRAESFYSALGSKRQEENGYRTTWTSPGFIFLIPTVPILNETRLSLPDSREAAQFKVKAIV